MAFGRFQQSMTAIKAVVPKSRVCTQPLNLSVKAPRALWAATQKMRLDEQSKEKVKAELEASQILVMPLETALAKLNRTTIPMPEGICLVDSGQDAYILYRSDKLSGARAIFNKCAIRPTSESTASLPSAVLPAASHKPPAMIAASRRCKKEDTGGRHEMADDFMQMFPQIGKDKVVAIIEESAGDEDLALENILAKEAPKFQDKEVWFDFWDTSKTGWLDKGELAHAIGTSMSLKDTSQQFLQELVLKWFESYDENKNGELSREEFFNFHAAFMEYLAGWSEDFDPYALKQFSTLGLVCQNLQDCFSMSGKDYLMIYFFGSESDAGFSDFNAIFRERYAAYKEAMKAEMKQKEVHIMGVPSKTKSTGKNFDDDWIVLDDVSKDVWEYLAQAYSVYSFPSLIVIDKTGRVVSRDGVQGVMCDATFEKFPWQATLSDSSYSPPSDCRLAKIRRQLKTEKTDVSMAEEASEKPATAEAYKAVVEFKSSLAMRAWVDKVLEGKDWTVTDEDKYASLIHQHVEKPSDLETLLDELEKADYIHKPEEQKELEEGGLQPVSEDQPSVPVAETPKGKGKAKGKGKGKGKGTGKGKNIPPPPVAIMQATASEGGDSAEQSDGKGKGKAGPPPPPPGGGKAKGKGKGPEPTREEKSDWKDLKTNGMFWKRLLKDDAGYILSFFDGQDEEDLNMPEFKTEFVKTVKVAALPQPTEEVKAKKAVVWDEAPNKKGDMDSGQKRKQDNSVLAITCRKGAAALIRDLQALRYKAILADAKANTGIRDDQLRTLHERVNVFTAKDEQNLKGTDSENDFEWDKDVEGFFAQIVAMEHYKERLGLIPIIFDLDEEIRTLDEKLTRIRDGVLSIMKLFVGEKAVVMDNGLILNDRARSIVESLYAIDVIGDDSTEPPFFGLFNRILVYYRWDAAEKTWVATGEEPEPPFTKFFRKVLTAGDCLNAGDSKKGRADGYDIIHALKAVLLINAPKGNQLSLIQYLKKVELDRDDKAQIAKVRSDLCSRHFPMLGENDDDNQDIDSLVIEHGKVDRRCSEGERILKDKLHSAELDGTEEWTYLEDAFKVHRTSCNRMQSRVAKLKALFPDFLDFLAYTEAKADKDKLCAGRMLGVIQQLVTVVTE